MLIILSFLHSRPAKEVSRDIIYILPSVNADKWGLQQLRDLLRVTSTSGINPEPTESPAKDFLQTEANTKTKQKITKRTTKPPNNNKIKEKEQSLKVDIQRF